MKNKSLLSFPSSVFSALLLLSISLSLQSCSHKPAPLEEEGDPPMTTMEMKAPEEDTTEKWDLKVLPATTAEAGKPVSLKLQLKELGASGEPSSTAPGKEAAQATVPGKIKFAQSHLIVICRDGNEFQNLRPKQAAEGEFSADVTFPHPGQYVLCLQFASAPHKNHTLTVPFQVGKGSTGLASRKPDADVPKTVDGYEFTLNGYPTRALEIAMPTFRITHDHRPVSNIEVLDERYPNDAGYAVLISDDSRNFVQTVPVTVMTANKQFQQPVMFHAKVLRPGNYKIWAQFKIAGKVQTVDFSFKVGS